MKTRLLIIMALIYMALTFLIPYNKVLNLSWQNSVSIQEKLFITIYFGISLIGIMILATARKYPKIENILNNISNIKIVYTTSICLLIFTLILTYQNITGLWWAWLSFGLQICIILLTYIILKNKMLNYEAIMVGVAISSIGIGIWEIPYQWGLAITTFPSDMIVSKIASETLLELTPIIGGIGLLFIINNKYKFVNFNKLFYIFLFITIILYIGIFINGFHLDMYYDWDKSQYIYNQESFIDRFLHKGSKVTLALSLISLTLNINRSNKCNLKKQ